MRKKHVLFISSFIFLHFICSREGVNIKRRKLYWIDFFFSFHNFLFQSLFQARCDQPRTDLTSTIMVNVTRHCAAQFAAVFPLRPG